MKTEERIENFNFPDRHPESYCHECGRDNPSWFAPNDAFNRLIPSRTGIMCPTCFLLRDKTDTTWMVLPEGHETKLAEQLAEATHVLTEAEWPEFPQERFLKSVDADSRAEIAGLRALVGELLKVIDALPLDSFGDDMANCDAADFVDHSAEFFDAMQLAKAVKERAEEARKP